MLLGLLLVSGLLNAAYFLPIVHRAFFRPAKNYPRGEANPFMVVPLVLTAALSLLFGAAPNLLFRLYDLGAMVTRGLLGGGTE
jgi:multicomponent Na+:H+ antiporter subunit D